MSKQIEVIKMCTVSACLNCPQVIRQAKFLCFLTPDKREIDDPNSIPDWCPLPDAESEVKE
jgi:hypothetical protein